MVQLESERLQLCMYKLQQQDQYFKQLSTKVQTHRETPLTWKSILASGVLFRCKGKLRNGP